MELGVRYATGGVKEQVSRGDEVAFEPHLVRPIDLVSSNENGTRVRCPDHPENLLAAPLASRELAIGRRRVIERDATRLERPHAGSPAAGMSQGFSHSGGIAPSS